LEEIRLVEPTLIDAAIPSPDGRYLLLATLHRPFSYQVPAGRFPQRSLVLDSATGAEVFLVADLPLADSIPIAIGSTRPGRWAIAWRSNQPTTLYWVEALDGGDASRPDRASVLYLLLRGYAVAVNPTLPIVGAGDREPNDT